MKHILALFLAAGVALQAAPPIPRPSPELKIHEPSGKNTLLSAQKGKVVVIQFLFTTCTHCQAAAKWLSKMQAELGPKGLEVYGVAINDEANTPDMKANAAATAQFGQFATYPIGISPRDPALKYMGISVMESWGVPMFAVIDKKGVIRAQTSPRGKPGEVAEESVMRATVTKLLAEK